MKKTTQAHVKPSKNSSGDWHANRTSLGMGDYYGTGVKNKTGRIRESMSQPAMTKKKLGSPPRSLA